MTAPAVVIRLELEAAPCVIIDAVNDAELARLADWIHARPGIAELVTFAIELEGEAKAA